jgi:glutamate/tyrosine decarboxylase-like PLP-dependent enzyme
MQMRCVNMIARLFNAPLSAKEEATGTSCIGSSEAIMLAGKLYSNCIKMVLNVTKCIF